MATKQPKNNPKYNNPAKKTGGANDTPAPHIENTPTSNRSSQGGRSPQKITKVIREGLELFPPQLLHNFGLQVIILVVIALCLYANTLQHDFVLDDKIVYTDNKFVTAGLSGIPDILAHDTFLGHFGKKEALLQGGRYRPLSLVTFAIEYQFFGKNPTIAHGVNIALFALTLACMLALLRRFMLPPAWAFLTVLLFAVHPIHTEVVANIKSRDEIMGWLFCIASLYGILYAGKNLMSLSASKKTSEYSTLENADENTASSGKIWLALGLSGVAFVFALLSKENALAYIAIIPATLYFFTGIDWKKIALLSVPFVLIIGLYFVLRANIDGGMSTKTTNQNVMNDPFLAIPKADSPEAKNLPSSFSQKYGTIMYVLGRYVGLLVYPHPLSWDYSYPQLIHVSTTYNEPHKYRYLGESAVTLCILLYLGLLVYALWGLKTKNATAYAVLFYLLSIFIVSNILVNIGGFMADRFLYQPSFGFCIALAGGLLWLNNRWGALAPAPRKIFVLGLLLTICLAGSIKTIARNQDWKTEKDIFLKDVISAPNSAHTHKTAGGAYYRMATDSTIKPPLTEEQKTEYLELSINSYLKSLELYPGFPDATSDIIVVWRQINYRRDQKNARWAQLLNLYLGNFDRSAYPNYNPEMASKAFNDARSLQHDNNLATQKLQEALFYQPDNSDYWYILGSKVYFKECNYEQGARCFRKCLELQPNNDAYWHDLGVAYHNNHNYNDAFAAFEQCLKINPNHPNARASYQKSKDQFKKEGKSYPIQGVPVVRYQ